MTQEGEALRPQSGKVSSIEGQIDPESSARADDGPKGDVTLPPQAVRMLMELTEMRTSFGPDPETAKILAETERHSEEKNSKDTKLPLSIGTRKTRESTYGYSRKSATNRSVLGSY
jgi:hypothetical protein